MEEINQNFLSSILEGRMFLIFGICSSLVACFFLIKRKRPDLKGLARVFLVLGLFQTIIGTTILLKSEGNKIEQEIQIAKNNQVYVFSEIEKTETLLQNLNFYRWTGISFLIVGLLIFFNFDKHTPWRGVGTGFIIQSLILELLNFVATKRTSEFLIYLKNTLD